MQVIRTPSPPRLSKHRSFAEILGNRPLFGCRLLHFLLHFDLVEWSVSGVLRVKDHKYLYRRGDQFYFRRKVPKGLEWAFDGKPQLAISLKTTSKSDARHELAKADAYFERKIAEARGKRPSDAVVQIAGASSGRQNGAADLVKPSKVEVEEAVRKWLAQRVDRVASGNAPALRDVAGAAELSVHEKAVQTGLQGGATEPSQTTVWIAEAIAAECQRSDRWLIEPGTDLWQHLILLVGRGQIEADNWFKQDFDGAPRTIIDSRFSPENYRLDDERARERKVAAPVSLKGLLDLSLAEKKLSPATAKVWKRHVAHFVDFIGHDDATKIKRSDVVAWKEALLSNPNRQGSLLSSRTIRDSYLAAIKSVLAWAAENDKIAGNPAEGLRVAGKASGPKVRDRGLNDQEALAILSATLKPASARLSPERALALRWVPWVCAYTGARVNEITQLRAEDVTKQGNIWTIHITPEAGSTKSGLPRTVAVHSHLIEQGFPAIVEGKSGPIFYDPSLHRGGADAHPQNKKVGEFLARWVRAEAGVTDPNIWPNHGWRHRFKTQSRLVRMDIEVRDYIQGHATKTEAAEYGYFPPEVTQREIELLPRYQVDGA